MQVSKVDFILQMMQLQLKLEPNEVHKSPSIDFSGLWARPLVINLHSQQVMRISY